LPILPEFEIPIPTAESAEQVRDIADSAGISIPTQRAQRLRESTQREKERRLPILPESEGGVCT